jgi:hypothetical protein
MVRRVHFVFLIGLCLSGLLLAEGNSFGIRFSGFVKTDAIWDTRQTVTARDGHYLLYPAAPKMDANDDDINDGVNFNILAIQTRLKGAITGPDAFGAKTGGLIEGAFFGTTNDDINGFRLRHAFLTLVWEKSSVLIGQFWHPMFVTNCFPGVVSFNTGAPFQPFSRNPQIRWTYNSGNARIIAAALAQRDFISMGPAGANTSYLRNSAIPNLHLQFQWDTPTLLLGLGGDWKTLRPRLETISGYKSTNTVQSMAAMAFAKLNVSNITWKVEGVYGQNMTDHLMLGGYGVESLATETGLETYIPTTMMSAWTDIETGQDFAFGLFAGVTQNLGADSDVIGPMWMRGETIDMIYRVSPRVMWNSGKTRFAVEGEYTAASYGSQKGDATVADAEFVGNFRLLLAAYYFF